MRYLFFTLILMSITGTVNAAPPEMSAAMHKLMEDAGKGSIENSEFTAGLQQLADKKDPVAQFLLGARIMDAEPEGAKKLLQESAGGGCAGATGFLGMLLLAEKATAPGMELTESAARSGNSLAQVALASFNLNGSHGIKKNRVEAYAWLRLAERQTYSAEEWGSIIEQLHSMKGELPKKELKKAETRYARLAKDIPVASYYLCGQSVPEADRDFSRQQYENISADTADFTIDDPTVVVSADGYEFLIPPGFEQLSGKPTIAGQFAYSKPHPTGGTGALIQLTSVEYDRKAFGDEIDPRRVYLEIMNRGLRQQHQNFSSRPAQTVQADIGDLLVTRWDGQKEGKNFSGFTAIGIVKDKALLMGVLDLSDNFEKFSRKYLLSIQSLRNVQPENSDPKK